MSDIHSIHSGRVPLAKNMREIAASLRQLADKLEAGEFGEILHAGVLLDNGRELIEFHRATRDTSMMEWAGLLHYALHRSMT